MKQQLKSQDIKFGPHAHPAAENLWTMKLSHDYQQKLSESMPTRTQKVIEVKGDMTKKELFTILLSFSVKKKKNFNCAVLFA
jgi:hypothetical protein